MSEFMDRLVARADEEGLLDVAYATLDTPLGKAAVAATRMQTVSSTPSGSMRVM